MMVIGEAREQQVTMRENRGKPVDFEYIWAMKIQEKERTLNTASSIANSSRNCSKACEAKLCSKQWENLRDHVSYS